MSLIENTGEVLLLKVRSINNEDQNEEFDYKKAYEDLKRKSELSNTLINISSDSLFLVDSDGVILEMNNAFPKRYNLTKKDMIGNSIWKYLNEETAIKRKFYFDEVIKTGKSIRFEDKHNDLYFDNVVNSVLDEKGKVKFVSIIARDITEQKQIEIELRKSEEKYRFLAENIKDVIWTLDAETLMFTYVSPSVERLRGFTPEEIITQSVYAALDPEHADMVKKLISERTIELVNDKNANNSAFFTEEVAQPCKDGTSVWTEVITQFRKNLNTGKIEIHGVTRDISERKQAEENIQKMGDYFRTLIENAPDGFVLINSEGNFKFVSSTAKRMFGFDSFDVSTKNPADLTHPDDLQMVLFELGKTMQNPEYAPTIQYRFANSSGDWLWVESTFTNLFAEPNIEAILINFSDITDRKLTENLLKEKQIELVQSEESLKKAEFIGKFGNWQIDLNKKIIRSSDGARIIYGLSQNEYPLEYVQSLVLEEYRPGLNSALADLINNNIPYIVDFKIKRANDGEIVDIHSLAEYDASKNMIFGILQDITEQKKAEMALIDSESRLRAVLDNSYDAVGVHINGIWEMCNTAAIKLFGVNSNEELIGTPIINVIAPDERERIADFVNKRTVGIVAPLFYLTKGLKADGTEFDMDVKLSSFTLKGKLHVLVILRDITEIKRVEENLRNKTELLDNYFNNALDLFCIATLDGYFLKLNKEWENTLGYNINELEGIKFLDLVHPDDLQKTINAVSDLSKNTDVLCFINRYKAKDGSYRIIEWKSKPYNELIYAAARDITDRVKVEEALKESESKYRLLFENMDEGFSLHEIITDSEGKPKDFTFLDVNSAYEKHTGFKHNEVVGKTMLEILPNADPQQIDNYGKVALTGERQNFEYYSSAFNRFFNVRTFSPQFRRFATIFEDITERKRAEEALAEFATRNQTILRTASDGIHIVDLKGNIIESNPAFRLMLGYTVEEILKLNLKDLDVHFQTNEIEKVIEDKIENASVFETRHRRKDGKVIDVEINAVGLILKDQKYLYCSARDITERKRSEKALFDSEEKFYKAFHHSPIAMTLSRLNTGEYLDVNEEFLKITELTKDEIIGRTAKELNNWVEPENRNLMLKSLKETGSIKNVEQEVITKSGSIKTILISAEIVDINGDDFTLISAQDITDRKLIDEKIHQISLYNRSLLEASLDPLVTIDENGKISDVNEATEKITGFRRFELIGTDFSNYFTEPELASHGYKQVFDQGSVRDYPLEILNKNGKVTNVLYNASVYHDSKGKVIGVFAAARDITEQKIYENEIKLRNKELAEINASKDKFFSIIAHDLRSPFSGFLGLTKMMAEETTDFTLKELQELSVNMKNSASNLYQLLENLLEWSRMQRGMTEYLPAHIMITDIVNINMDLMKEFSIKKEIKVINSVPKGVIVKADLQMINTILRNLISNSIKFTPIGGQIEIGIYSDNLTENQIFNKSNICVFIKDNGIGMNPDLLSKLFKLDEKVSRPGTEDEPSTGLGLLLCKDFIEKNNGKLWVESEEGNGSTFYFTLPIEQN